ncbi:MAG: cytochrome c oxidase subunit II [Chloroflexi bacterium]|nr:MAG: cytochrome c oxidase subunit II [Chloroflexota bacterium]
MHPPLKARRVVYAALPIAVATALALGGCTASPATAEANSVAWLYNVFLAAAGVVFVVVAALIGWSVIRYRGQAGDASLPPQTHGNLILEVVWWALPTLLVIGLFVISAQVLNATDKRSPSGAVRVRVEGFQWQWRFTYLDSGVQLVGLPDRPPQLVLPVGEQISFELVSADVIHSFYIPHFLLKRDTIPGLANRVDLTIDRAGTYGGQCAEFCGLLHARMVFSIRAVAPSDFQRWLSEQRALPPSPSP